MAREEDTSGKSNRNPEQVNPHTGPGNWPGQRDEDELDQADDSLGSKSQKQGAAPGRPGEPQRGDSHLGDKQDQGQRQNQGQTQPSGQPRGGPGGLRSHPQNP